MDHHHHHHLLHHHLHDLDHDLDHDHGEIPHHFICPISLQLMQDPVTVATGITYDRRSIQRWHHHTTTCPVTNQPLPAASGFTPNHTLRRLIHSWCSLSDQLPPEKPSLEMKVVAFNLIKKLKMQDMKLESLESLRNLALESEKNRVCLKEVGVVRALIGVVVSCYQNRAIDGLKEAIEVLHLVRVTQDEARAIMLKHGDIISSLTWVLSLDGCDDMNTNTNTNMKLHAIVLLKDIINDAKPLVLERLNRDFFKTIVREINNLEHGVEDFLHVMLTTCTWPRNCSVMVELGAVFELVELELRSSEKTTTELIMAVLVHLCSSADGRAKLLSHAAGLAMITKRIAKVSRKVDESALMMVSLVSRFSGTDRVLKEMVRVGTVEKLCMVLQVNGMHSYTREKAKEILKRHSNVWKDSPCLDVTLLTRLQDLFKDEWYDAKMRLSDEY